MPKKGKKAKDKDPKKAAKLAAKAAANAADAALRDCLRAARAAEAPLAALPPAFLSYNRNGLQCEFEHHTHATLPPADLSSLNRMLRTNGASAKQLADDECRLLLVRATGAAAPPSPAASPVKEQSEEASATAGEAEEEALKPGSVAAFLHFRYEAEEDAPLLKIYEMSVAPAARRKGLGKMTMMIAEMVARKAGMGGAMLTLPRDNAAAKSFYTALKYGVDPMDPSKLDPTAEEEKPFEVFSKFWDDGVLQVWKIP